MRRAERYTVRFVSLALAGILLCTGCGKPQGGELLVSEEEGTDPVVLTAEDGEGENSAQEGTGAVAYTQPIDEGESVWMLAEIALPDPDAALEDIGRENEALSGVTKIVRDAWGMAGDTVYCVANLYGDGGLDYLGSCVQKLEAPYAEWKNYPISAGEWMEGRFFVPGRSTVSVSPEGSVYLLLWEDYVDGEPAILRAVWQEESGFSSQIISGGMLDFNYLLRTTLYYADSEQEFFVNDGLLQYFDTDYSAVTEWRQNTGDVWQVCRAGEGQNIYLFESAIDGDFCVWAFDNGTGKTVLTSDEIFMDFRAKAVFLNGTEGYLCTDDTIWHFSIEGDLERFLSFREEGYIPERILSAGIGRDGMLYVMMKDMEGAYHLLRQEGKTPQDKKELEFACTFASSFLKTAVKDFNRQNKEYNITLRVKGTSEYYEDYWNRIQAEMATGNGPDLLYDGGIDVENLADKGALLDLTDYFLEDRDRLPDNVWEDGLIGDRLYSMDYCCRVESLVGDADVVGDRTSWTVEEMMACVRDSGVEAAVAPGYNVDATRLYWEFVTRSGLIDWEAGKSDLDTSFSAELLAFAKQYADQGSIETWAARIVDGEVMLYYADIIGVEAMANKPQTLFHGRPVYIGFPTQGTESGSIFSGTGICVNAACKEPEGAIAFLRFLLTDEEQEKLAKSASGSGEKDGMPVTYKALDSMLHYAGDNNVEYGGVSTGGVFFGEEWSEEELEQMRRVILEAKPWKQDQYEVLNILYEETPAYFLGDRSAQEVCAIMQNRVQLYLDEQ